MAIKRRRGRGEGTLFKLPSGRWRAQITRDGKRESFGARTKEECQEWRRKMLFQIDNGLDLEGGRIQLEEWMEQWLEIVEPRLRPKTFYQYTRYSRLYIAPMLGDLKLKELTPQRVQKFYGDLTRDGKSAYTVRHVHRILHLALDKAAQYGMIHANPAKGAVLPSLHKSEIRVLDADEVGKLLTAASGNRLEALFQLAVVTGMRQGELMGLKWSDVSWSSGTLHVQRQLQRVPGQGWTLIEPKTRAGRRIVSIGPGAIDALRRQKERQNLERAVAGKKWNELGLIFANSVGNPMDAHNLRKAFIAVLKEAGLPEIRFHDLRHTAASLMLNHNVPLLAVSRMLGHANPSITLNTYAHLYNESLSLAGQVMDELVTPVRVELTSVPVEAGRSG